MGPSSRKPPGTVLRETVDKLGDAFAREVETWEEKTRAARARGVELFSKEIEEAKAPVPVREDRRARKRREEAENASTLGGAFSLVMAAVLLSFAFRNLDFWWLIFVALGVGRKGVKQLVLASRRTQGSTERVVDATVLPPQPVAARRHEVDVLCDALLSDLAQSPDAVRSFLQQPEATIESLRATAKALDVRRQQLAREAPGQQVPALEAQRQALLARFDATTDGLARTRLNSALESLDGQLSAMRSLQAVTERVEGEYTSLLAVLHELKAKLSVARSAGTPVQVGALHENLGRLNDELEAISDALLPVRSAEPLGRG